jgi:hypothetical protein
VLAMIAGGNRMICFLKKMLGSVAASAIAEFSG